MEAHIAADELSSFLDVWTHQFTAWLYYMEPLRNCAARNLLRGRKASAEAPFELCCIKKVIALIKMQAKIKRVFKH